MNRRDYLTILTALAVGGYLAVSALRPDGLTASSLFGASQTKGTYGDGGYGTGRYGR